jgi:hypothetical protein
VARKRKSVAPAGTVRNLLKRPGARSTSSILGDDEAVRSPLWMVATEPVLNEFVVELQKLLNELLLSPRDKRVLKFSRSGLLEVRTAFANMIRHGEHHLHRLASLVCDTYLKNYQMESVVIGEVDTSKERFTITQRISKEDLYGTTDIDLGNSQLSKLQFFDGSRWSRASLVANVVEYQPLEENLLGIHRIISRIKAEEEIWNKVVDEIFDLDSIVLRDKNLRHLSRYVKDIFGIKIIVGELEDVYRVHDTLLGTAWTGKTLKASGIEDRPSCKRLTVVEVKDYLARAHRKRSGWEAVKSVVQWWEKTIEIQVQPLPNFLREREYFTDESHKSFKLNRDQVRDQVAERIPLFGFYQDLLRWLFLNPELPAPAHKGVTAVMVD